MSPWWLLLIVPGTIVVTGLVVFAATLLYIGSGMFR